jgi:hypothetical protein
VGVAWGCGPRASDKLAESAASGLPDGWVGEPLRIAALTGGGSAVWFVVAWLVDPTASPPAADAA